MKKRLGWVSLVAFWVAIVSLNACKPRSVDLLVLCTTDVHGALLPYDFKIDDEAPVSLANVSYYVKQQREQYGDRMLLLDNGDKLSGYPPCYYYNVVNQQDEPMVYRAERYLGYDYGGVGTHDMEVSECHSPKRRHPDHPTQIVCANIIDVRTHQPFFTPYVVTERGGIKIAVLGMISPYFTPWLPKKEWSNVEVQDMIECAQKWLPVIRAEEDPDLIIGLFHSGNNYQDKDNELETYKNPNGGIPTAIMVPGFDLVFLGRDHVAGVTTVTNVEGKQVPCLNAGLLAEHVAQAKIHMEYVDGEYRVSVDASLVDMHEVPVDEDYVQTFASELDMLRVWINTPIGYLSDTILCAEGIFGPSTYRTLIHNAQLWYTGADISMASITTVNDTLFPGPITTRDLYRIYRYENQLQLLEMTGEEVRRFLEWSYGQHFLQMHHADSPLIAYQHDSLGQILRNADGRPYLKVSPVYLTSATGIHYTVDISKPAGQRINIQSMSNGKRFNPKQIYTVALNSFQASGGGDFIFKGIGWNQETLHLHTLSTPVHSVRQVLSEYIQHFDTLQVRLRGDWTMQPASWWQKAKERAMREPKPVW